MAVSAEANVSFDAVLKIADALGMELCPAEEASIGSVVARYADAVYERLGYWPSETIKYRDLLDRREDLWKLLREHIPNK